MEQNTNPLAVSRDELVPAIKREGYRVHDMLAQARIKYGERYNQKNAYEELFRRFGDPRWNPEKFADEYLLILDKKSQEPASVRAVIRDICFAAFKQCLSDKLAKISKAKTKEAKEKKAAEKKSAAKTKANKKSTKTIQS